MSIKTKEVIALFTLIKKENDKKGKEDNGIETLKEVSMIYLETSDSWEVLKFHLRCSFKISWNKLKLKIFGV